MSAYIAALIAAGKVYESAIRIARQAHAKAIAKAWKDYMAFLAGE